MTVRMKDSSVVSANQSFLSLVSPPGCLHVCAWLLCRSVTMFCLYFPFPPLRSHFIYKVPLSSHLPPTRSPLSGRWRKIAAWRLLNILSELNIYGLFCDQLFKLNGEVSGQLSCIPPFARKAGGVKDKWGACILIKPAFECFSNINYWEHFAAVHLFWCCRGIVTHNIPISSYSRVREPFWLLPDLQNASSQLISNLKSTLFIG